jgi:predicted GIY-YIG superfamily endonuclease
MEIGQRSCSDLNFQRYNYVRWRFYLSRMSIMAFFVYLLESSNHATYIGATVDLDHRLRQHNKEIKGGARATSAKVAQGEIWTRICYVEGFPDWKAALQFEWAWKFYSRKLSNSLFPRTRRKQALDTLLSLERPTSKAIAYQEWDVPPNVVWESSLQG